MTRSAVALTAILAAATWIWRVADARSLGIGGWGTRALSLARLLVPRLQGAAGPKRPRVTLELL